MNELNVVTNEKKNNQVHPENYPNAIADTMQKTADYIIVLN